MRKQRSNIDLFGDDQAHKNHHEQAFLRQGSEKKSDNFLQNIMSDTPKSGSPKSKSKFSNGNQKSNRHSYKVKDSSNKLEIHKELSKKSEHSHKINNLIIP